MFPFFIIFDHIAFLRVKSSIKFGLVDAPATQPIVTPGQHVRWAKRVGLCLDMSPLLRRVAFGVWVLYGLGRLFPSARLGFWLCFGISVVSFIGSKLCSHMAATYIAALQDRDFSAEVLQSLRAARPGNLRRSPFVTSMGLLSIFLGVAMLVGAVVAHTPLSPLFLVAWAVLWLLAGWGLLAKRGYGVECFSVAMGTCSACALYDWLRSGPHWSVTAVFWIGALVPGGLMLVAHMWSYRNEFNWKGKRLRW